MNYNNVLINPIFDGAYYKEIVNAIQSAKHVCYCSLFIVDHNIEEDRNMRVDNILFELAAANWRGVDTKLIIGGSRSNQRIMSTCLMAFTRAKDLGIAIKLAASSKDYNSHVKLAIIDNKVITGSHNWSKGIFGTEIQDSAMMKNGNLALSFIEYFENQWKNLPSHGYYVSL